MDINDPAWYLVVAGMVGLVVVLAGRDWRRTRAERKRWAEQDREIESILKNWPEDDDAWAN